MTAHERVVLVDEIAPAAVVELARALGRTDDVRKEDGRKDAIRLDGLAHAGQELLDLGEDFVAVDPRQVVDAGQLHVSRGGDVPRKPARALDVADRIVGPMDDERRDVHGGRNLPHVYLERHLHERDRVVRALRLDL